MKIEIRSRRRLLNVFETQPFPANTALISITDKDKDFVKLKYPPDYLLQLKFDDIGSECFDDWFEDLDREPTETEKEQIRAEFAIFNESQAEQIADFLMPLLTDNKLKLLICQCEFGQSRSAGLAAAVQQFLYKTATEIFADYRFSPNKVVYRKTLAALESYKKE
jgi:predicted protein tyrosine phosphatase